MKSQPPTNSERRTRGFLMLWAAATHPCLSASSITAASQASCHPSLLFHHSSYRNLGFSWRLFLSALHHGDIHSTFGKKCHCFHLGNSAASHLYHFLLCIMVCFFLGRTAACTGLCISKYKPTHCTNYLCIFSMQDHCKREERFGSYLAALLFTQEQGR